MLNYNKIHSSINFNRTAITRLAKYIGIPNTTLRTRIERENLLPNDIEKIADFFEKTIAYYFDREESEFREKECEKCEENKKEIESLTKELLDVTRKYSKVLEELRNKKI